VECRGELGCFACQRSKIIPELVCTYRFGEVICRIHLCVYALNEYVACALEVPEVEIIDSHPSIYVCQSRFVVAYAHDSVVVAEEDRPVPGVPKTELYHELSHPHEVMGGG
jgi:hypothetical protein